MADTQKDPSTRSAKQGDQELPKKDPSSRTATKPTADSTESKALSSRSSNASSEPKPGDSSNNDAITKWLSSVEKPAGPPPIESTQNQTATAPPKAGDICVPKQEWSAWQSYLDGEDPNHCAFVKWKKNMLGEGGPPENK